MRNQMEKLKSKIKVLSPDIDLKGLGLSDLVRLHDCLCNKSKTKRLES